MKELDDLVKKVGNDKVLHFLGGAWICAVISFVVIIQKCNTSSWDKISSVLVGTLVVVVLSVVKEIFLDDKADWMDVVASVAGCITILQRLHLDYGLIHCHSLKFILTIFFSLKHFIICLFLACFLRWKRKVN